MHCCSNRSIYVLFILFFICSILSYLTDQGYSIENIQYITESDIQELFVNCNLAIKSEFRQKLIKWRLEKGFDPPYICDVCSKSCKHKSSDVELPTPVATTSFASESNFTSDSFVNTIVIVLYVV